MRTWDGSYCLASLSVVIPHTPFGQPHCGLTTKEHHSPDDGISNGVLKLCQVFSWNEACFETKRSNRIARIEALNSTCRMHPSTEWTEELNMMNTA
jgi:hypothetical protein